MESFEESNVQVTESELQPVNLFNDGYSPEVTESVVDEKLATFLRIRPIDEVPLESTPYSVIDSNHLCVEIEEKISVYGSKKPKHERRKVSSFNHIFESTASQNSVFNRCCLPLVNDVLNGTNALLFCFGTTSSGKSYTIRGPPDDPARDPGLIPLSLRKIFSSKQFTDEPTIGKCMFNEVQILDNNMVIEERQFKHSILSSSRLQNSSSTSTTSVNSLNPDGYKYVCRLSYSEIYNDQVYDLLMPSTGRRGSSLDIVYDSFKRFYIKELKSVMVSSFEEAMQVYSYGWANLQRNVQETGLNKNSSRSHSFFSISIIKYREDGGLLEEAEVSNLTLGDLAGSERQNKTHSEGMRMKEGGNINVSLMHLKECFNQTKLSQKNPNRNFIIPFRNSNLTKFFQPYLTGTGRVWMIVNINPSPTLLSETIGTLDLGETASHISINSTHQLKLEESTRRMTQVWLQSSQRWSSFAGKYKNPQIIVESTREEQDYCELLQPGADLFTCDREEQIRKDVIAQFEEILAETMAEHERDLQIIKETWEKKMEARLALSDKRYQTNINHLQNRIEEYQATNLNLNSRIEELTNELFTTREKLVQFEQVPSVVSATQTDIEEPAPTIESTSIDVQTDPSAIADGETQTDQLIITDKETQTEIQCDQVPTVDSETQTDIEEPTPTIESTSIDVQTDPSAVADGETQTEIQFIPSEELEVDDEAVSPKRCRMTVDSSCPDVWKSARKSNKYTEKAVSVKKPREVFIDSNYFSTVSELTKRKRKEEAVASPSTEIANEYLKLMLANAPQCPPSTTKKSVKRSTKKPPRKSTRTALKPEPPEVNDEDHEMDEDDVEEDELASLLVSQKKGKKSKGETSAIKVPAKRKRIPTNNEFLEVSISSHIEDEPSNEPNIKGGRVLRPRRKIKF